MPPPTRSAIFTLGLQPRKKSARTIHFLTEMTTIEKRKNFKEQFLKTLKAQPVEPTKNRFSLSDCAIKKAIR